MRSFTPPFELGSIPDGALRFITQEERLPQYERLARKNNITCTIVGREGDTYTNDYTNRSGKAMRHEGVIRKGEVRIRLHGTHDDLQKFWKDVEAGKVSAAGSN